MPAIATRDALAAIEDARSELSPQTYKALAAIGEALLSLTYEAEDAKGSIDSLQTDVMGLQADHEG